MGASQSWWIVIGLIILDTFAGYFFIKDNLNFSHNFFLYLVFCSANWQIYDFMSSKELEETLFWVYSTGNYTVDQLIIKPLRFIIYLLTTIVSAWLWTFKFIALIISPHFFWCIYKWVNNK